MFRSLRSQRNRPLVRTMAWLLLIVVSAQSLVPAGYMPADWTSGTLVKLCPQNASADLMAILHEGHHHHVEHAGHNLTGQLEEHGADDAWSASCPYGALLVASDEISSVVQAVSVAFAGARLIPPLVSKPPSSNVRISSQPRAPPLYFS